MLPSTDLYQFVGTTDVLNGPNLGIQFWLSSNPLCAVCSVSPSLLTIVTVCRWHFPIPVLEEIRPPHANNTAPETMGFTPSIYITIRALAAPTGNEGECNKSYYVVMGGTAPRGSRGGVCRTIAPDARCSTGGGRK